MKLQKRIHNTFLIPALCVSLLLPALPAKAAWEYDETEHTLRYQTEDGSYLTSTFQEIKGYTYYFDADGTVHTGWLNLNGKRYFFSETGAMLRDRWVGDRYLLANGEMARSCWVANHTAYVDKNGVRAAIAKKCRAKFIKTKKGTKYRNIDGSFSAKTWQCIKGHWYYFYSTGYMAKRARLGKYYVDKKGQMVTNRSVKIGNYRYFYGADGRQFKRVRLKKNVKPNKSGKK